MNLLFVYYVTDPKTGYKNLVGIDASGQVFIMNKDTNKMEPQGPNSWPLTKEGQ